MDIDELKERYKMLPLWGRLLGMLILGVIPAVNIYMEEGDVLAEELVNVESQEQAARARFEKARQKKVNLPKLEEQLAFTEEQLKKARKKLPNGYRIEDVLQKTATIAKEIGLELRKFDPLEEKPGGGEFKYMELPIQTELTGSFSQIASFYDKIAHLESTIFVRNIDLGTSIDEDDEKVQDEVAPFMLAKLAREKLVIKAVFELVIFRAMTDQETMMAGAGNGGFEDFDKAGGTPGAPAAQNAGDAAPLPDSKAKMEGASNVEASDANSVLAGQRAKETALAHEKTAESGSIRRF